MELSSAAIAARATELRYQEILNEVLKTRFNGQPHASLLGDVTFPDCDLFFNQTQIDAPDARQQIHLVFVRFVTKEIWWGGGVPGAWASTIIEPTGGVAYGATTDEHIEEAVHGAVMRRMPGVTIRWQADGSGLHEQTQLPNGTWTEIRFFAGANAIRWQREPGTPTYTEQTRSAVDSTTWTNVRTVQGTNLVWDGPLKEVTADTLTTIFARVANLGADGNRADFACRALADNLKETFQDAGVKTGLAEKGVKHIAVTGPSPSLFPGFQCRTLTLSAKLRYFIPRQQ